MTEPRIIVTLGDRVLTGWRAAGVLALLAPVLLPVFFVIGIAALVMLMAAVLVCVPLALVAWLSGSRDD